VLPSNLCRDNGYHDWDSSWFYSLSSDTFGILSRLCYDYFLSNSFLFIEHSTTRLWLRSKITYSTKSTGCGVLMVSFGVTFLVIRARGLGDSRKRFRLSGWRNGRQKDMFPSARLEEWATEGHVSFCSVRGTGQRDASRSSRGGKRRRSTFCLSSANMYSCMLWLTLSLFC
jgi:hypothetical protein